MGSSARHVPGCTLTLAGAKDFGKNAHIALTDPLAISLSLSDQEHKGNACTLVRSPFVDVALVLKIASTLDC
jgi:hypothetical protein